MPFLRVSEGSAVLVLYGKNALFSIMAAAEGVETLADRLARLKEEKKAMDKIRRGRRR